MCKVSDFNTGFCSCGNFNEKFLRKSGNLIKPFDKKSYRLYVLIGMMLRVYKSILKAVIFK